MAGNYADPTSWRMALDRDGSTLMFITHDNQITELTAGQVLNSQKDSTVPGNELFYAVTTQAFAVVFPEKRDIDGYQYFDSRGGGSYARDVQTSVNTTNGIDGTWVTQSSGYAAKTVYGNWRNEMINTTVLGVKAIRFRLPGGGVNGNFYGVILSGEISPGENPDRLVLWDDSTNNKLPPADFDWGFVPRSSSEDRLFRVKNNSASLNANNVIVASDIIVNTTPSVSGQLVYSYGGGPFLAQVNIGSLAPGAISNAVTVRRVTPSNAVLGMWLPRTSATATTWT